MGELGGFLKITRTPSPERDPRERVADYKEIYEVLSDEEAARQGARCMECGVPFCHEGCPLGNLIPDWNDLVYQDRWREAIEQLHATNDFPEWTGLICPAPCEPACVLSINDDPVSIKQIELAIVERAWDEGWIVPRPPDVAHRAQRRRRRLRTGGARGRGSPQPRRARRDGLRARRGARRAAALRRAGLQAREALHRPPDRPARGRGRAVQLRRRRRRRRHRRPSSRRATTRSCWRSARACTGCSTCRARTCAGVRFAMDYLYARNRWVARGDAEGDDPELTGGRQARRRDRRRRHGDGLRRQRPPRAREERHGARHYPAPPGPARARQRALARGTAAARQHLRARRGRRAALDPDRHPARRPRRPRRRRPRHLRHAAARAAAGAGHRFRAPGRPRAGRDRLLRIPSTRAPSSSSALDARPARQREGARRTRPRAPACSPRATRASASRWSSTRSPRAAAAPGSSTATSRRSRSPER